MMMIKLNVFVFLLLLQYLNFCENLNTSTYSKISLSLSVSLLSRLRFFLRFKIFKKSLSLSLSLKISTNDNDDDDDEGIVFLHYLTIFEFQIFKKISLFKISLSLWDRICVFQNFERFTFLSQDCIGYKRVRKRGSVG